MSAFLLHENLTVLLCSSLQTDARCHAEGGGDGGKYGYHYLDNLSPTVFVVVFVVAQISLVC